MTNEEALNQFNSTNPFMQGSNKQEEYFNVIRNALEKQIPKKVTEDEAFGQCPVCGYTFNSELVNEYDIKYCPFCGQALDFSERSNTDEN